MPTVLCVQLSLVLVSFSLSFNPPEQGTLPFPASGEACGMAPHIFVFYFSKSPIGKSLWGILAVLRGEGVSVGEPGNGLCPQGRRKYSKRLCLGEVTVFWGFQCPQGIWNGLHTKGWYTRAGSKWEPEQNQGQKATHCGCQNAVMQTAGIWESARLPPLLNEL